MSAATPRRKETLDIPCGSEAVARIVMEAIRVEADDGPGDVKTKLAVDGQSLHIHLDAPDEVELKATKFSLLRLSGAARRVAEIARA